MEHLNNQPIVAASAKSLWQYFVESYTQNYFNFKGRARRREYWGIWLFNSLVTVVINLIGGLFPDADRGLFSMNLTWSVICTLWYIISFFPQASAIVRRLHDKGYSGKWYLGVFFLSLIYLPLLFLGGISLLMGGGQSNGLLILFGLVSLLFLVLVVFIFILLLLDGDKTENKYGPSPKYMPIDEYVAGNNLL